MDNVNIINTEECVARAVGYFKQGYNCAQSVVMAFAPFYSLPDTLLARISSSFGGGIGRMRETCGAACGMFLLAGLEVDTPDDTPSASVLSAQKHSDCMEHNPYPSPTIKKKNYEVVQQLAASFRQSTGSLICKELLGLNRPQANPIVKNEGTTPDARTDEYYKKRPCIRMIETATRIYCDYLNSKYNNA